MAYHTINLSSDVSLITRTYAAAAAVTPGHLVELNTAGKVRKHSTAGATATRMFALEDEEQGHAIGAAYAADGQCKVGFFAPGTEVYALLKNGETAAIGNFLESAGDGTLQVADQTPSAGEVAVQNLVGFAAEAVDMSGSSGVDPSGRIRIIVL